jgi:hypothetical protein
MNLKEGIKSLCAGRLQVAILFALVAAVIGLAAWETGGLRGEVFLVSSDGAVLAAPGAEIWIVRASEKKNLAGLITEYERTLATIPVLGSSEETWRRFLLARENSCAEFALPAFRYLGPRTATTTADREGRFSVPLLPGRYIIWASGQAGTNHAEWTEEVHVYWRSYARLASPLCKCSAE